MRKDQEDCNMLISNKKCEFYTMEVDKIAVGKRLFDLRKRSGMSRNTASSISSIPEITIKTWESGAKEARLDNLVKYLEAFETVGCYNAIEWVLYGGKAPPRIAQYNTIGISSVVNVLKKTSNLFYCLGESELILYMNQSWAHYLDEGLSNNSHNNSIRTSAQVYTEFKDLCSRDVYETCYEHYVKCLNGQSVSFSYVLGNEFSKSRTEVTMLYEPIIKSKDNKAAGVFGFLSSKIGI